MVKTDNFRKNFRVIESAPNIEEVFEQVKACAEPILQGRRPRLKKTHPPAQSN